MAAASRRNRRALFEEGGELNLTPLLDVIFNLIFFFILATTIRTEESYFDLTLPESTEAPPQEVQSPLPEILVGADGVYTYRGERMDTAALRQALARAVEQENADRAVISADAEATVQSLTNAMDLLREAGITDVIQRVRVER